MISFIKHLLLCTAILGLPAAAIAQTPNTANTEQTEIAFTKEALIEAYQAEQWGRSAMIAKELLKSEPDNSNYLSMLGVSCAKNNENECAKEAFEKARDLNPDDAQIYANLCAVYTQIKFEDHIDTCIEATKRVKDNANLFYLTGQKLEKLKRTREAREMYEAAWKLEPKNNMYLTAITSIDFGNRNYKSALEITEKGITEGEDVAILYLNAIIASLRLGDFEKALKYADIGYNKYHDPIMLLGKAEALDGLAKFNEADEVWKNIKENTPEDSLSNDRYLLGFAKHQFALSCSSEKYRTCDSQTPDPCCARENETLTLLEKITPKNQNNEYQVYLGIAQILAKQLEKAEATLTKAVNANIDRDNASALAALAAALYQFDDERDKTAAKRYYTQAVNASPDFANFDQLTKTRAWPPRLIETLKQIQNDIDAGDRKKASGCSCEMAQNPTTPFGMMLLACFALIALAYKRQYR